MTMEEIVGISLDCFKIDKTNAKAMIDGFIKDGKLINQAIYCDVEKKRFPKLITLNKGQSKYSMSKIGRDLHPNSFKLPLKYIAVLDSQYFIRNNNKLWETICSNGLFDVWLPESPYKRFDNCGSYPSDYRIILLRVYEIHEAFRDDEIIMKGARVHHVTRENRFVTIKRPVVSEKEFSAIKSLLKSSIKDYILSTEDNDTKMSTHRYNQKDYKYILAEEVTEPENIYEGAITNININIYERNLIARRKCIEFYGLNCSVCGFNFAEYYGDLGHDFIHVHHLKPLSEIKKQYKINPIEDLRPVCPNCHTMLHSKKPALGIDDLKNILSMQIKRDKDPIIDI